MLVSTGASNVDEIKNAIKILKKGTKKIVIMHCILNYPTLDNDANLNMILSLKKEFPKIKLNAGHDLNLENLKFFLENINNIEEVSIGHALICDTFDYGLEKTIKKYLSLTKIK